VRSGEELPELLTLINSYSSMKYANPVRSEEFF